MHFDTTGEMPFVPRLHSFLKDDALNVLVHLAYETLRCEGAGVLDSAIWFLFVISRFPKSETHFQ